MSAVIATVRDTSTVIPWSPPPIGVAMGIGAGGGGGGAGDGGVGLGGVGFAECAWAGDGVADGLGAAWPLPAPAAPGALDFFFRRIMRTITAMMMMTSNSMNSTPRITPTIHSGKLDFSLPSAFACWLL